MSTESLESASQLVERGLASATRDCCIIVEELFDADIRFANNTTTTNGLRRTRTVTAISFSPTAEGVATGIVSRSGAVEVAQLVEEAEHTASLSGPAQDASDLLEGITDDAFEAPPGHTSLQVFDALVGDLGEAFARARAKGHVLYGFAQHQVASTYLGTSAGMRRRHVQPTGSFELVARADGGARSSWRARASEDFAEVSVPEMEARLLERLSWAVRTVELPAGRYEVILPPDAVADLIVELWSAMSGRAAEDGGNVFSAPGGGTRLGERLFARPFVLESDPYAPEVPCAPFLAVGHSGADVSVFDNGAALGPSRYVEDGVLSALRYHRAGARRSGQRFLAPVDNLILRDQTGRGSLEDLVKNTERALLLTCLWYIREVDPATQLLTGLTRDGVYLVEHGEVVGAVNNFRFNESPLEVLKKTVESSLSARALSREWGEWMNRTVMPALRVEGFNMSSVSQAS